ncbi:MAG: monovalent cation/H+ antiporter complex subunit F [Candidatus Binatia bacterium]
MTTVRWVGGSLVVIGLVLGILVYPLPFLFFPDLPYLPILERALYILLLAAGLCLYRISRGPTAADRAVAVDILGILIVGFCAILTISTGRSWYIDIGIAWALQSFIGTLALAKYLEGKGFDE